MSVYNVAKYILERRGRMTTMKLQKLVYYAQAWSVADDDRPLFDDSVKAWEQGPVVPGLWHETKGRRDVGADGIESSTAAIGEPERTRIDTVLAFYGDFPAEYLSELTHFETPWRDARALGKAKGIDSATITIEALRDYYRGRTPAQLEAAYQMSEARKLMDLHADALAYLAR